LIRYGFHLTHEGFQSLFEEINIKLNGKITKNWVILEPEMGWLRAELYSSDCVLEERISDKGLIELHLETFHNDLIKLLETQGITLVKEKQTQEAI